MIQLGLCSDWLLPPMALFQVSTLMITTANHVEDQTKSFAAKPAHGGIPGTRHRIVWYVLHKIDGPRELLALPLQHGVKTAREEAKELFPGNLVILVCVDGLEHARRHLHNVQRDVFLMWRLRQAEEFSDFTTLAATHDELNFIESSAT